MSNEIKTAKFSKSDWLATALLLQFKKPYSAGPPGPSRQSTAFEIDYLYFHEKYFILQ